MTDGHTELYVVVAPAHAGAPASWELNTQKEYLLHVEWALKPFVTCWISQFSSCLVEIPFYKDSLQFHTLAGLV